MVMNDLMEGDKKVSALAIMCEWDIKGDLKRIVGGWKYQRERMGRNNRLQTQDRQSEQYPRHKSGAFPASHWRETKRGAPFSFPAES